MFLIGNSGTRELGNLPSKPVATRLEQDLGGSSKFPFSCTFWEL